MAKGSLFWGNGSGKLGEAVFYRSGGEQRTRTYVKKIKNPKTLAQVSNRLSMKNFSVTYRLLQPILSQSFTLRKTNQSGFNAFIQKNKNANSPANSVYGLQNGLVSMDNFVVSDGTLLTAKRYWRDDERIGFVIASKGDSELLDSLVPTSNSYAARNLTTEELSQVFTELGLSQKAVVTCIKASWADEGYRLSYMAFSVNVASAVSDENIPALKLMQVPSETGGDIKIVLGMEGLDATGETLGAVIISDRDANGKLLATQSSFLLPEQESTFITDAKPGGYVWTQVLEQVGFNQDSALVSNGVITQTPEDDENEDVG